MSRYDDQSIKNGFTTRVVGDKTIILSGNKILSISVPLSYLYIHNQVSHYIKQFSLLGNDNNSKHDVHKISLMCDLQTAMGNARYKSSFPNILLLLLLTS